MDNKKLGIIILLSCVVLGFLVFTFTQSLNEQAKEACDCTAMQEDGFCPHAGNTPWPTYLSIIVISCLAALSIYLIFFEKSQKEIISTLEKQKQVQTDEEKFSILLKGLNAVEQKVIKAIKEQDGITQQTLRIRTDLHKSNLSLILDSLEKKGLIKKVQKGKTNQVFLKIKL